LIYIQANLQNHVAASQDAHLHLPGVPGLIKGKMERELKNIDKCLVCDEREVRIHKEYSLPANHFILSIHDLTKSDLGKLGALANRYLKSWLGMPQRGSFLTMHYGLGMDVKSVSHLYKQNPCYSAGQGLA
jgi:hypothetical protein